MTMNELQEKLQEKFPLLRWKVAVSEHPPRGLLAYHAVEWWDAKATVIVGDVDVGVIVTESKEFFVRDGSIAIIGQRMAYMIGYEIVHYGR